MSIPVFHREDDGTAWEGYISYNWSKFRENKLVLNFSESSMSFVDSIYKIYGVCPALDIATYKSLNTVNFDHIYRFLYGYTINELMEVQEEETYSCPGSYLFEPIEWKSQMVASMDWELFCLAYYAFLCSNSDFDSDAWKVLGFILNTLKNEPDVLSSLLSNCGRVCDSVACTDFWETICAGLQIRIRSYLCEETCYTAFRALSQVSSIFCGEMYKFFMKECGEFFDKIAITRIDDACEKTYTYEELIDFNIEELFFYEKYFKSPIASEAAKQYVMHRAFTFLHTTSDKVVSKRKFLEADAIYEISLKYTQTEEERALVRTKREKISYAVSRSKITTKRLERIKERIYDVLDNLINILAVVFFVSIVTAVISGILTVLGIFKTITKTVLIVSVCIMAPFLILFAVDAILNKMIDEE